MQHNFVLNGHKLVFCFKSERMKTEPLADGKEQFQPYMHISEDTEMFRIFDSAKMNSTFSILLRIETLHFFYLHTERYFKEWCF